MDPQWGDIVNSAGQAVVSFLVFITQTIAQMAEGFVQVARFALEDASRFFSFFTLGQVLIAASLVIIYLGYRNRLSMRGLILFLFGLGFLFVGLANLVNPGAMPVFLRV